MRILGAACHSARRGGIADRGVCAECAAAHAPSIGLRAGHSPPAAALECLLSGGTVLEAAVVYTKACGDSGYTPIQMGS